MNAGFTIPYQLIDCSRCHSRRVRGITCPDCGRQPDTWEVDNHWLRRRQTVPKLEQLLDERPAATPWRSAEQFRHGLFEELQPILPAIFRAIRAFVAAEDDGAQLKAAIEKTVELRERVRRVDSLRPFVLLARTAGGVTDELEQMLRSYLAALTANVPLRAQQLAEQAQTHIDLAASHLHTFNQLSEGAEEAVDITSSAMLVESTFANYMARTGATLEQVLGEGEQRIHHLLGVVGDTNAGVQLLLFEEYAAINLDHDRFLKTVVEAHQIFTRHGARLAELMAESPELLKDYVDVQVGAFNSGWQIMHSTRHAQTDRQVLETALDLEVELVEGVGAFMSRLLMLVIGHKTAAYAKLKQGYATEDLRVARSLPDLQPLLGGLAGDIRTAVAHRQVSYAGSGITITPRSGTRQIDVDELLDILLQGIESMLACLVALRQALFDLGIDAQDQDFLQDIGVSTGDLAEIALRLLTGADVTIFDDSSRIVIEVVGDVGSWSLFSLVGSLGPLLDEYADYRLTHITGTSSRSITGPTIPYRGGTPSGEFEQQVRCIRVALTSCLDGEPWMNRDQHRKWAANKAVEALQTEDLPEAMRNIRQLVALALETQDAALEQLMRDCMRWRRLDRPDTDVVDRLRQWALADLDWEAP